MTTSKSSKRVILKAWALVSKKRRYGDSEIGEVVAVYAHKRTAMLNRHPTYHKIVPFTFSLPTPTNKRVKK